MDSKKRSQQARAGIVRGLGHNSAYLNDGATTRQLGEQLTRRALHWIWRWGWAAPGTIDYVCLDGERRGKAARLEARGLIKSFKPGSYSPDSPRKVLKLTDAGIEELSRLQNNLDIGLAGTEVRWSQLRHDYIVQNLAAEAFIKYGKQFETGPELAMRQSDLHKVPDAIIDKEIIEVELTPKKPAELERAAWGLVEFAREGRTIKIISTQVGVLQKYYELLRRGTVFQSYKKNNERKYVPAGYYEPLDFDPQVQLLLLKKTVPSMDKHCLGASMYDLKEHVYKPPKKKVPLAKTKTDPATTTAMIEERMAREEAEEREEFERNQRY